LQGKQCERLGLMLQRLFDRDSNAGDLLRRVGQTFAARLLLLTMSLVSGVIIARTLGPSGRGEYAVASAVAAIGAQFAMLGMHASNTYYLARDKSKLSALLGNSLAVSWLAGGAIGGGVMLFFSLTEGLLPLHGGLLLLAALAVPVYASFTLLQNLLLGLYETGRFNRVEITMNGLSLTVLGALVLLGWQSPLTVYGSSLLVAAFVVVGMFHWLLKAGRGIRLSASLLRDNFGFSLRAYLSALIFLLVTRIDLLLISHLQGAEATGHYAIAASIAELLGMLAVVTGNILFPRLSGEEDPRKRWKLASQTAMVIGTVVVLAGGLSIPLAEPLLDLMYGKQYLPAAAAYSWLVPGVICLAVNTIWMNYFAAEGMPPIVIVAPAVVLLLKLMLGLLLIPMHGIEGAAVAASISYGLMLAMSGVYLVWLRRPVAAVAS